MQIVQPNSVLDCSEFEPIWNGLMLCVITCFTIGWCYILCQ